LKRWRDSLEQNKDFLEKFDLKDVKFYPGSPKGPNPKDDPEFFAKWYVSNSPPYLKQNLKNLKPEQWGMQIDRNETKHAVQPTIEITQASLLNQKIKNSDVPFADPEDKLAASKNDIIYYSKLEPWEVLPFPEKLSDNFHDSQEVIERWALFRIFPVMPLWMQAIEKFMEDLEHNRLPTHTARIPSLYTYYNLLPEFARENPIVKNVVRCLEFTKHDMSMKDKELMLNYACQFTLPMDPLVEEACKEAIISMEKMPFTMEHEDFLIGEEDENLPIKETPGEYVDPYVKDRRYLARMTFTNDKEEEAYMKRYRARVANGEEWPMRPALDPYIPEEDPNPSLPIQFYDNGDGFWNDYIGWKENEAATFPVIIGRPYFKH